MKKWIVRLALVFLVLIILAVVAVRLFFDSAIKRGIETAGTMLTKVEIKLDSVNLSLLSGSGKVKQLVVGNPQGFKTPSAIQVGTATMALKPGSVFSDKVVITSINVQGPEITYETDLKTSNLKRILANIDETTGGGQKTPTTTPSGNKAASKKLQVDDFVIKDAKLHLSLSALGNYSTTLVVPEIHVSGLGQGPDGITAAELTRKVLELIEAQAAQMAIKALSERAAGLTKEEAGKAVDSAAENLNKSLGGLLKKK